MLTSCAAPARTDGEPTGGHNGRATRRGQLLRMGGTRHVHHTPKPVLALMHVHSTLPSLFTHRGRTHRGPPGTEYEGGVFTARLKFPPDYPLNPPKMRFISDMWHPNSCVLLSLLHSASAVRVIAKNELTRLPSIDCSLQERRGVHLHSARRRRSHALRKGRS